jgi:integrase
MNRQAIAAHRVRGPLRDSTTKVSSKSIFADDRWYLDAVNPATPDHSVTISWGRAFEDARTETRAAGLKLTAKRLIYFLIRDPLPGRRPLRSVTASGVAVELIRLIRWMVSQRIYAFAQVNDKVLAAYIRYRQAECVSKGKTLSAYRHCNAISPCRYFSEYRERFTDKIAWDPASTSLRIPKKSHSRGRGDRIPDTVGIPFVSTAIHWVHEVAPDLLALQSVALKAAERVRKRGMSRATASRSVNWALGQSIESSVRPEVRNLFSRYDGSTLASLLLALETACGIVIAALTGIRPSELMGLKHGCRGTRRLHDGRRVLTIRSALTKTSIDPSGTEMEWVAGFVSSDNDVDAAIGVLEALRRMSKRRKLDVYLQNHRKTERAISTVTWTYRINAFRVFCPGIQWWFTGYQFRRLFARFVAIGNKSALFALQHHFKHVSYVMTDVYGGSDLELLELVHEERAAHVAVLLENILRSDTLAGPMGVEITSANERFRGRAGESVLRTFILALLEQSSLSVLDHYYGLCLVIRNRAKCQGETKLVGLSTCMGCPNLAIHLMHLPFWSARLDDNRRLLEDAARFLSPEAQADLEQIICEAEEVVTTLTRNNK